MRLKVIPKTKKRIGLFGLLVFVVCFLGTSSSYFSFESVYAVPETSNSSQSTTQNGQETNGIQADAEQNDANAVQGYDTSVTLSSNSKKSSDDGCKKGLGGLAWIGCLVTEKVADAVDWIYSKIEGIFNGALQINPAWMQGDSAIRQVWEYIRILTNAVFIGFFLVVIYSQLTGYGISNYGIKKVLPKVVLVAILINLSFLICALAIDISNVIGNGIQGFFASIEEAVLNSTEVSVNDGATMAMTFKALALGTPLVIGGGAIAIEYGMIWMIIPMMLGGLVSVVSGLITITLRQAVVALLVMISPLAFVAYMLPNTEEWFKKWKKLFTQMLVFYPAFGLLFGASNLAAFAIRSTAVANQDAFWLILSLGVQVFPLLYSVKLMKMSGTFLGDINARMQRFAEPMLTKNREWADSHRRNKAANTIANSVLPHAALMRRLDERRALREKDTENARSIIANKSELYVQRRLANVKIGDEVDKPRVASRYTRNEKSSRNYDSKVFNAAQQTNHVMGKFGDYYKVSGRDKRLAEEAAEAWKGYNRAIHQKSFDDEADINWWVDQFLRANERDENNNPVHQDEFNKYIRSVISGPYGEERLLGKVIRQASAVETQMKSDASKALAKYGYNGYNKKAIREWLVGYKINDDGWAIDRNGDRLRYNDGTLVEVVQGDALTKAPEKLVLYDKRDEHGVYFDMRDQEGKVVSRIYRGKGIDGINHENAAFIKEVLSNWDIPISDPINNVFGILSGIKPGSIVTPQGQNEIGLSRYSTTIAGALNGYKGDASWAGAMFNTGIGNRQIHNSAQYAIWVLDSIKKTLKPGVFNTQNPASVEYLLSILDPKNWDRIFTEEEIRDAVNINNELFGGEEWLLDGDGKVMRDEKGKIRYREVANPNYEQRMNTIKRKLIFPALAKILPAFERLRTSNTADNQKPGTADMEYDLLDMVLEKYGEEKGVPFDPTLVDQDLQLLAREFRRRKHDREGNLIYAGSDDTGGWRNLYNTLEDLYDRNSDSTPEVMIGMILNVLQSRERYGRALQRFIELCDENPNATTSDMREWFVELDGLVN